MTEAMRKERKGERRQLVPVDIECEQARNGLEFIDEGDI